MGRLGFFFAVLFSSWFGASISAASYKPIRLGIRYALYTSSTDPEIPNRLQETFGKINTIWKSCGIQFLPELVAASPSDDANVDRAPANLSELFQIRRDLKTPDSLLVAVTDPWKRTGTLGKNGANAWTAMPGAVDHGIVVEWNERWNANLLAHELGHYLGLVHRSSRSELMAPVIYRDSQQISEGECTVARTAVVAYWKNMIRE